MFDPYLLLEWGCLFCDILRRIRRSRESRKENPEKLPLMNSKANARNERWVRHT
jgi:hypothetical protein